MEKILQMLKEFYSKFRTPILATAGVLLFIVIFGAGIFLGWLWTGMGAEDDSPEFRFTTLFTGRNDYRMISVAVHMSSRELARRLRGDLRQELIIRFRRVLDEHFRVAGADVFSQSGEALTVSREIEGRIRNSFEAQIRDLDSEAPGTEERIVLAVTIFFLPAE